MSVTAVPLIYVKFGTSHPRFWSLSFLTLKIGELDLAAPSLAVHQHFQGQIHNLTLLNGDSDSVEMAWSLEI